MKNLTEQRKELVEAVSMSYSPEDFPGSNEWRKTNELQAHLEDFDIANPEIKSQNKAAKKANDKAVAARVGWI